MKTRQIRAALWLLAAVCVAATAWLALAGKDGSAGGMSGVAVTTTATAMVGWDDDKEGKSDDSDP